MTMETFISRPGAEVFARAAHIPQKGHGLQPGAMGNPSEEDPMEISTPKHTKNQTYFSYSINKHWDRLG